MLHQRLACDIDLARKSLQPPQFALGLTDARDRCALMSEQQLCVGPALVHSPMSAVFGTRTLSKNVSLV